MSNDSSDKPAAASAIDDVPLASGRRPLGGFNAALLSVLSVGAIYFVLPVIAAIALYTYAAQSGMSHDSASAWLTNSVPAQFFYVLITEVLTIASVFGLVRIFGWRLADIGLIKPKWYQPLYGVLAAVPYYALYIALVAVVSVLVPSFNINQSQEIGFHSVHGTLDMTLTFFSLVVLPPLAEEIAMRGFLYTGLRKWLPRLAAALIVSGLFGAAHLAEGGAAGPLWIGALDTFVLSMVLLFLREKTGNLWAGITLHATKNLVAYISLFVLAGR